jgi:LysM repeat protein
LFLGWQSVEYADAVYQPTPFLTPTPGLDGRIVYEVQPDDTLWRIAAISGVTVDELRALNNLDVDDPIVPSQILLLAIVTPSVDTPEPGVTVLPSTPTLTPGPGFGDVCVALFNDENGDAMRQDTELIVAGGAINIANRSGSISETITTDETVEYDPYCFEELPEGDYNLSAAVPDGYNPTSVMNKALVLIAGDTAFVDFGVQLSSQTVIDTPEPSDGGRSPLLGVFGVIFLLGGIALGVYTLRLRK